MKKIVSVLMILVTLFTFSVTAMAADVEFVPSIGNKGAPELVVDGDVIGHVRNPEGDILSTEHTDCLIITPVAEANTSTEIPEDARDILLQVYEELSKPGTKLSEECPELKKAVAAELGENKTADDLVVRDLFDVTSVCSDLDQHLAKEGNVLDLTFKLGLGKDAFVTAMVYVDGAWKPLPKVVNNGDGTVTAYFEALCPVAFLVEADVAGQSPDTGDHSASDLALWIALMAVSLALIVVLVVFARRSRSNET
ncbi:MAG: hypothetical protein IJ043_09435 [Clostridia bacterium]|nr:hypothetical protein [Clostridia bacterium]